MRALHASFRAETNSEVMLRRGMNQESESNTFQVSMAKKDTLREPQDFSLVLGGPLFQLLRRSHLTDDALDLTRQRIIVISLFAWLPLLALSALEGQLLGGRVTVPFLLDLEVHIKFLLMMPLLIAAELVVHQRVRLRVPQFLERNLIPESVMTRFDAVIASAFRLRNSVLAEVLLIAFVYGVGILIVWRRYAVLNTATWYATPSVEGSKLSLAGMLIRLVAAKLAPVVPLILTMMPRKELLKKLFGIWF